MKGTPYAARAVEWLEKGSVSETGCIGCHVSQSR
jgi:hypothetical protein